MMKYMPVINLQKTGANITKLRQRAGLTVKDIQHELGLNSTQAVYKWENGKTLPSVDNLVLLASVLEVGIEEIVICDLRQNNVA